MALDITRNTRLDGRTDRWITHYSSQHKILLVGEGDFSFSACLARTLYSSKNIVATSYDSQEELYTKHWSAAVHVEQLKALGCTVLYNIDVHDMHEHFILKKIRFDRIIYNFPHAGHDPLYGESDNELIRRHKELVSAFFQSSSKMLTGAGEVHVSHRNDYPYNRWKLAKLAKRADLVLAEMIEFRKADYPGYHNKRGGGIRSNKTFPLKECFTFKFSLPKCSNVESGSSGRFDECVAVKLMSALHISM